ncbi:MAG: AAA family ATPase [Acetoanaerobium sp.]|nr:AAA family ATPase [Acetoanaerobium sp.]
MKIAITGKGGVGKTTVSSILSRLYADEGYRVLAVDADPDANLALALGFTKKEIDEIVPISEIKDLIAERTGAQSGSIGSFFKMNPKVDDIPERYCRTLNGVSLLTMGTVDTGGSGCVCPEHVLLKRLTPHLVLQNKDVIIMDMEAGIEHLGRGTASGVDAFIVVIEPGVRSLQTFEKVKKLANDIGVSEIKVVANKIRNKEDEDFIRDNVGDSLLGFIHYSKDVIDSDRNNQSAYDADLNLKEEIKIIKNAIESSVRKDS